MNSLISFVYLSFLLETTIVSSSTTPEPRDCLFFATESDQSSDYCYQKTIIFTGRRPQFNRLCATCVLHSLPSDQNISCSKSYTCSRLFFYQNVLFERFVERYRDVFETGFGLRLNEPDDPVLIVHVNDSNLRTINYSNIQPIITINSPSLSVSLRYQEPVDASEAVMALENSTSQSIFALSLYVCERNRTVTLYYFRRGKQKSVSLTNYTCNAATTATSKVIIELLMKNESTEINDC